jgi:N6-adenosine-specific RNA methylase IME4
MTAPTFKIDQGIRRLIPALIRAERDQLETNIVRDGCREPLSVWKSDDGDILVDGHNRFEICSRHSLPYQIKKLNFADRTHVTAWVAENQLGRRNLTDDQRSMVADDLREARAKISLSEHAKTARAAQLGSGAKSAPGPKPKPKKRVRAAVAQESKLPEKKLRHAQQIKAKAPEVAAMVRTGTITLLEGRKLAAIPDDRRSDAIKSVKAGGDVRAAVRTAKKTDYVERVTAAKPKPLEGTYRILYADPCWKYVGLNQADEYGHAERHYDCLDYEQLIAFKPDGKRLVKDIADDNSVLFCWVTSPLLERCFPIIRAWGFSYKASFVWDKVKHNMGHYNSVRHEFLLITKGICTPDVPKLIDSVQEIERSAKHSEKPEDFRRIIEAMYNHGRKLQLFARVKRRRGPKRSRLK